MKRANYTKTIVSILACLLIGFVTNIVSESTLESWYLTIEKPFFMPPFWLFKCIWYLYFALLGYSFAIIWSRKSQSKRTKDTLLKAKILFGAQLTFNVLWFFIFFKLGNPFLGLIEILLFWLILFETFKLFKKINYYTSKLLLTCLVWVSFVTILNGTIWFMNS